MALKLSLGNFLRINGLNGRYFQTSSAKWNAGTVNFLNYGKKFKIIMYLKCKIVLFFLDKDPAPSFFNSETQELLSSITGLQLEKIFKKRTVKDNHAEYKFLTDKQLEKEVRKRFQYAKNILQMPPVLKVMEDKCKVLSKDAALTGYSPYTYVFTDVTYGLENNKRMVTIRTPDGTLQEAPYEVRKRSWQIYFPSANRSFREPAMFEPDNLKKLLNEEQYEFILDRACTQYEPYEQKFHDITSKVYLKINEKLQFDFLRSTRHFGPMAFFFAWHKMIDDLLLDMIRNDLLKNGVQLIVLMYRLNGIKESTEIVKQFNTSEEFESRIQEALKNLLSPIKETKKIDKNEKELRICELCFEYIQDYVSKYSPKKAQLELALQTYKEWHNELKSIKAIKSN